MTEDETEFLLAMSAYQKRFRRRYPTWREVLNVLRCLGYRKVAEPAPIDEPQPPKGGVGRHDLARNRHAAVIAYRILRGRGHSSRRRRN